MAEELTFAGRTVTIPASLKSLVESALALQQPREMAEQIKLLSEAIGRVETGEGDEVLWAMLQTRLGEAFCRLPTGDRTEYLKHAESLFQRLMRRYPRDKDPSIWAAGQEGLGCVYVAWIQSDRPAKLEQAIECFEAALDVYAPRRPARLLINLGVAYLNRTRGGVRAENIEQAISCFETARPFIRKEQSLSYWILVLNNLGVCYKARLRGDPAENIESSIQCYQTILKENIREALPYEWALAQCNLGHAYNSREKSNLAENIEQAIQCYEAALEVWTRDAFPLDWAVLQNNLGCAYRDRVRGIPAENQERAIIAYEAALTVHTAEQFPYQWANVAVNLGNLYRLRTRGNPMQNKELAVAYHHAALQILNREETPHQWAVAQSAYASSSKDRLRGNPIANIKAAIRKNKEALKTCDRQADPVTWAVIQTNLGVDYAALSRWSGSADREQAIKHYRAALEVRTREAFPYEWASLQHNLGLNYRLNTTKGDKAENRLKAVLAFTEALKVRTQRAFPNKHRETARALAKLESERKNWEAAHASYVSAQGAEELLLALGAGVRGQNELLQENKEAAMQDAFVLVQLGRLAEAAVVLENSRARGLAQARALDAADPNRIRDPELREQYLAARAALIEKQQQINAPWPANSSEAERRRIDLERTEAFRQLKQRFDAVVKSIRDAHDPADFLYAPANAEMIFRAAHRGPPGHAIVYLFDTYWGGHALAAISGDPEFGLPDRFDSLKLPKLKTVFLSKLVTANLEGIISRLIGGFAPAQQGRVLPRLRQEWPGKTFRELANSLHHFRWRSFLDSQGFWPAMVIGLAMTRQMNSLDKAAKALLQREDLKELVDKPFATMPLKEGLKLEGLLDVLFLEQELEYVLRKLAGCAIRPLARWLRDQGVTSVTLIPCGALAAFPLSAVPIKAARNPEEWETLGDRLFASTAPSARSLLTEESQATRERSGVYALGNPLTPFRKLPWAEAEAELLARLGGDPGRAVLREQATRPWLLEALRTGKVVDAACHGEFIPQDFLRSRLLLAQPEVLMLGEALNGVADLRGLRLLLLSACQTAILDLQGARDEVHSLSVGMLQAGAQAVLGTLWPVDDRAAYLLIARFAKEWFPHMDQMPPSQALARAQHWLRRATLDELRAWEADLPTPSVVAEAMQGPPEALEALLSSRQRRGVRYTVEDADRYVRGWAKNQTVKRPFAHPIYWAAFQITGW